MDFKVSDHELAYDAGLAREHVEKLVALGSESAKLIDLLIATGIRSERISVPLEADKAKIVRALYVLEQALAPIIGKTNAFIEDLDADDAQFD
ncbi:hypothetical protein [uncultured Olsenella sp.]|uniref:hypothetical protein n=1 Tax=uncultured Olsenella sp. TaxID=190764 RepID=UPI0026DD8D5C|nr:hypothetical protein [uncultured Olsenella sp.]